jgi:amino acid permease
LWATLIAAITPSTKPKFLRSQTVFLIQRDSFKKSPWIVVLSQHFSHGAADRAYATFKKVFEFFNV